MLMPPHMFHGFLYSFLVGSPWLLHGMFIWFLYVSIIWNVSNAGLKSNLQSRNLPNKAGMEVQRT